MTRFRSAIRYAFGELLDDLAGWLILGFLVAGIIGVILPDNFFAGYLGAGFGSMVVLLIVGIPLYICATASTPIAAAMLLKGLSPGAALVFLLAGPATNISSLLILRKYFEKKYLLLYLITISVVALLLGLLLNGFYSALNLDVRATLGSGAEFIPAWLEISAAFVLGILILLSLLRKAQHWWLKYHS